METVKRIFNFEENVLPDLGVEFTPEQTIEHYSSIYPELTCGFIKGTKVETGQIVYTIAVNTEDKS